MPPSSTRREERLMTGSSSREPRATGVPNSQTQLRSPRGEPPKATCLSRGGTTGRHAFTLGNLPGPRGPYVR